MSSKEGIFQPIAYETYLQELHLGLHLSADVILFFKFQETGRGLV